MKYLVMETRPSYSIVLDESGRVIKAANTNHEVGQTVARIVPLNPRKPSVNLRNVMSLAGALVAVLALAITLHLYQNPPFDRYASVYMTINPEIRMDVDVDGRVGDLDALNSDGNALIRGYAYKGKSMYTVVNELADAALKLGQLSEGRTVTLEIDTDDEAWFVKTGTAARESLISHLPETLAVTIEVTPYEVGTPRDFSLPTPAAAGTPAPPERTSSQASDEADDEADIDDDDGGMDDVDDDDDDDTDVDDEDDDDNDDASDSDDVDDDDSAVDDDDDDSAVDDDDDSDTDIDNDDDNDTDDEDGEDGDIDAGDSDDDAPDIDDENEDDA
jgi:hypothetical protein